MEVKPMMKESMKQFRFGIRDLLWAMAVLGVVIGWWAERTHLVSELQTLREQEELLSDRVRIQMSFGLER
jgi:hypothetical protein